jgi:hypothetical protein
VPEILLLWLAKRRLDGTSPDDFARFFAGLKRKLKGSPPSEKTYLGG